MNFSSESAMLPWIVLLPLLGAIINGFFGQKADKRLVTLTAVGSVGTAFLIALYCFKGLLFADPHEGGPEAYQVTLWKWFEVSVGGAPVPVYVRFVMDHLSGIMTVMVTGIATLIHVYSTEYMGEDPGYPRFMTYLNLFTASMLVLVLGSSLPLMFVGWEGVGLCSYLLIGFWWENPAYAAAGRKAFVVNRVGDFDVLIGTFVLLAHTHSFEFATINHNIGVVGREMFQLADMPSGVTIATVAALFLFLGCTGKSAQLPLYVWLPDAMAGPTPVSALIHAATMVTAGVYLCARLSPVFQASPTALATIAVVGSLTALMGASIGVVQHQMKKILAYSTVSQLGFMFAAVGCGAFAGGMFHVFTHAFFKACLFLGAGSVMHAVHAHGDADIRYLGNMQKYMPTTRMAFWLSCFAIAGFPLFSGFFSKDDLLFGALEATIHLGHEPGMEHLAMVGYFVFAMLALSAFLTAFYMFRLYYLTFTGEFRGGHGPDEHGHGDPHDHDAEPHESGSAIQSVLMILAFGAVVTGFLGLPHWLGEMLGMHINWWMPWLNGHEGHGAVASWGHGEIPSYFGPLAMAVGTAVGLGGIGLAHVLYSEKSGILIETETAIVRGAIGLGTILTAGLGGFLGWNFYLGMLRESADGATFLVMPPAFALVCSLLAGLLLIGLVAFGIAAAVSGPVALHAWAFDKWRVDELYHAWIIGPFRWLAVVSANIDRIAVDGSLTWVPAQASWMLGWLLTRTQTGKVATYAMGLSLGAFGLVWWLTYPHIELTGQAEGSTVTWSVNRGPGYEYRWDFDSDGVWDSDWHDVATAQNEYGNHHPDGHGDAFVGLVAIVSATGLEVPLELDITEEGTPIPLEQVSAQWGRFISDERGVERDRIAPVLTLHEGPNGEVAVLLNPHDASISQQGLASAPEGEEGLLMHLGDSVRAASATIRIGARVRATVQARSAFGNRARAWQEMVLQLPRIDLQMVGDATSRDALLPAASASTSTALRDALAVRTATAEIGR